MLEKDELLQRELSALENGAPLDEVVNRLPEDGREFEPLIRLAAAVRSLPHPEPLLEQSRSRLQRLRPAGRRFQWQSLRWALAPAMVGALALLVIFAGALLGLGLSLSGPRDAQAATLMDVNGRVEVASGPAASDWRLLSAGEKVHSGQRVRTSNASGATLVFFDGSRTTLGSNADLTLARVDGDRGKVLRVVLNQNAGKTSHSVVPLRGKKSSFMVLTPSGAASVHGTTFDVAVDAAGKSRFAVNTGKVLVTNESSEVYLAAGQAAFVQPGALLESPAYQFHLEGVLTAKQGSTWVVAGVPFTANEETSITGDPQIGDEISVDGRVLELGEWVADSIAPAEDEEQLSTFTGILHSDEGETWQIGEWTVQVDAETDLGEGLEVDSPVRVTFTLLDDGSWLAVRIETLEEASAEPTPTSTPAPDPAAKPVLSFQPGEMEAAACPTDVASGYTLTGKLANTAGEADDVAVNVTLGYQITGGAEYVDAVELNPSGWESIPAGEQVSFSLRMILNAEDWQAAAEGSEVQVRVFIAGETNNPEAQDTRLAVTLVAQCEEPEETSTPTPSITPTPEITATVTPTPTLEATPVITDTLTPEPEEMPVPGVTSCTGAQPHPTGMTLAQRYGVPYEEIMSWFCQGFGFGEIDLAYSLSLQSGQPVASIFEMKSSGMGWGQIKQQLAPESNPNKPGKENPGKGRPGNSEPENPEATPEPPGGWQPGDGPPPKPPKPPKKNN